MVPKKMSTRAATIGLAVLTATGIASGAATAQAAPAQSAASSATTSTHYDKNDLVDLFAFGSGRAAQQHPEVLTALYGKAPTATPSAKAVGEFTNRLESVDPSFDRHVLPGLTSSDPMRTQAALTRFESDSKQVVAQQPAASSTTAGATARPNDVFYSSTNVVVDAEAVQSVAAVTTAIGAAEVVGVFFYRFTNGVSGLDKDQAVSAVSNAFA